MTPPNDSLESCLDLKQFASISYLVSLKPAFNTLSASFALI